jgi:hypothetical protein
MGQAKPSGSEQKAPVHKPPPPAPPKASGGQLITLGRKEEGIVIVRKTK